jgi:hypothetical protein
MFDETDILIKKQLDSLPATVRDAILHSKWTDKVHALAKKYNLHIDQEGDLVNEVFLVMLGLEMIADFHQNLINKLGISTLIATQIEGDMNEEILKPIRTDLQAFNREVEDAEIQAAAAKTTSDEETALTRESILNEIENPLPTPTMAQAIQGDDPQPLPVTILKEEPISAIVKNISDEAALMPVIATMPTANMIEDKLKKVVKSSKEEVAAAYNQTAPKPATEIKKTDPYRESV